MYIKKVGYQEEKVNELLDWTNILLNNDMDSSLLVFKAPTGSGKTIMVSQYIQKVCNTFDDDICFVWLSLGKGDLHIQSKKKLESIFEGFPKVSLLTEEYFGSREIIDRNEVVVVNWESINSKDRQGNYINKIMRDGEYINFRQVLANTRDIGRKIILIIDESHYGTTTERAEEIKNEIQASIILEMSATPKYKIEASEIVKKTAGWVEVDIKDVIAAEMIKKQLIVNEGFADQNQRTIDRNLLEAAYQKRLELKKLYELENSNVNPLIIVQLPNAEEGASKKDTVIQFFLEKGLDRDKHIAVWLADEKEEEKLEHISDNDNEIQVLLFKQAVDTGWDCPRAQILLRFREIINSIIFEKQVLGRILRMPEQKHYSNDILNMAYLYTDYLGNVLSIIESDYSDEDIKPIPLVKMPECENITLYSEFAKYIKKPLVYEIAKNAFNKVISDNGLVMGDYEGNRKKLIEKGFDFDLSHLTENIISKIEIDTGELLSNKTEFEGEQLEVELDEERTELFFRRILRKKSSALGNKRDIMFKVLLDNIYQFFFNYISNIMEHDKIIIEIQKLFLLNYKYGNNDFFFKLIEDVIENYKKLKGGDLTDSIVIPNPVFKIREVDNVSSKTYEEVNIDKYFYNKCYLQKDRTKPEKAFEKYIQRNIDKIDYWVKNGDNGSEYFSIVYELEGEKNNFYPDYIIKFLDGRIGLFEAKDKNDNSAETKAKAERLQSYLADRVSKGDNLIGGIVANFGDDDNIYIKINRKPEYKTDPTDWEDLDGLI